MQTLSLVLYNYQHEFNRLHWVKNFPFPVPSINQSTKLHFVKLHFILGKSFEETQTLLKESAKALEK